MTTDNKAVEQGLFPISTVSEMTGVNSITLRAWERRYGLIKPNRTAAKHRVYSVADVERIREILNLLDEGISIGRVAEALQQDRSAQAVQQPQDPWYSYQESILKGISNFDEAVLEQTYNEAISLYPVDLVTSQLLLPLLKRLGDRWQSEALGVAEEHFFSVFMRNKLGARFHHRNLQNSGPRIVAACLPGELHEFGLLLFALSAHTRGYRIILMGADMPLSQLAEVVRRIDGDAVALSGSIEAVKDDLDEDICGFVNAVKVPVVIGGSYAEHHRKSLKKAGATPITTGLTAAVQLLGQLLK